jgi:CubicO group peptidase (beta-lactamase class C family)
MQFSLRLARAAGIALLCGLDLALASAQEPTAEQRRREALERFRLLRGIPGLSFAIGDGGAFVQGEGLGLVDLENEVPARAESVYRLASVSKAVTGVLALRLVERGALDLDAEVQRYVPSFPVKPEGAIRVRHLLCHQSGIRHYRGFEMLRNTPSASLESALAIFASDALLSAPGAAHHYTTYGYTLLGCALERASEREFAALLAEELAVPLGLSSLRVDSGVELIRHRAQGYVRSADGSYRLSASVDTSYKIPGGGLVSSAPDAARLLLALGRGEVLKAATRELLFTPQPLADGKPTSYALGWRVHVDAEGRREVWHTGAQQRVSTILYGVPSEGFAAAIFCNLEGVKGLLELARELRTLSRSR